MSASSPKFMIAADIMNSNTETVPRVLTEDLEMGKNP